MANLIHEYLELVAKRNALDAQIAAIEANPEFAHQREFNDKLQALMQDYGKNANQVLSILDPSRSQASPRAERATRTFKKKVYTNPQTGEQVHRAGGPFPSLLKSWMDAHGKEEVESWAKEV
ncbi:TPA: histone-like nucleoid-structuring protein, MvaT/MvaU family [Pseudomonas aeruginosa]|uniref:histone-like nucleoid-structuring protein, MvaT/MvaU family n=1 Tax=Pseudomonas aeruginosa TaxID=287 RepID=UPI0027E9BEA7|nr:DNA binding protein [Pseudomonas aeruginosa]EKY4114284.1 DNA binding protein [Pseudomonas aeruginosa]ELJ2278577.1 DNA binding protein [Pseudomonas aeruginosa]MCS8413240.1 DNA binding protein [Pseudomonas aeruginosa]MCS9764170.1 DNA binding protein [Pseudomonas aeruginosa]